METFKADFFKREAFFLKKSACLFYHVGVAAKIGLRSGPGKPGFFEKFGDVSPISFPSFFRTREGEVKMEVGMLSG